LDELLDASQARGAGVGGLLTAAVQVWHTMPDTPVAPPDRAPYDPAVEQRFSRLEDDVHDLKALAARSDARFASIEAHFVGIDVRFDSIDTRFASIDTRFASMDARFDRVEMTLLELKTLFTATLPHLATKADLADVRTELKNDIAELKVGLAEKPSRTYMWGILAVLLTAYGCGLAGLAVLK
jgi:hypothetical protein